MGIKFSADSEYTDPDGDGIALELTPISARFTRIGDGPYAGLPRDQVVKLVRELSGWLNPASEPVYGADTLYGQLIRQAVAAEVARVLPLHLAPVARVCAGQGCQVTDEDEWPEPHDVGHPVYEDAKPHPVNTDPAPGFLGATLPVGPVRCGACDHAWGEHMVAMCWGEGSACTCAEERPAPVPVAESATVWGEQGQAPTAPDCAGCGHAYVRHNLHTASQSCMGCGPDNCARYRSTR